MRKQIGKFDISVEEIEKNLINGVRMLSHDQFLSAVKIKGDGKNTFTVIIPHYIDNISGINSDEDFGKAVNNSPERKITLILESNKIKYQNHNLRAEIPFESASIEVLSILKNLKYITYKDSGFVTTLIDNKGIYLQGPPVLLGSFGKMA